MNKRLDFFKDQIGKDKWAFDYPLMDWLRARVLDAEVGSVKMQFTVETYMLNPIGIMHGEAKLYNADNKIIAKAASNLIATSVPLPV